MVINSKLPYHSILATTALAIVIAVVGIKKTLAGCLIAGLGVAVKFFMGAHNKRSHAKVDDDTLDLDLDSVGNEPSPVLLRD